MDCKEIISYYFFCSHSTFKGKRKPGRPPKSRIDSSSKNTPKKKRKIQKNATKPTFPEEILTVDSSSEDDNPVISNQGHSSTIVHTPFKLRDPTNGQIRIMPVGPINYELNPSLGKKTRNNFFLFSRKMFKKSESLSF